MGYFEQAITWVFFGSQGSAYLAALNRKTTESQVQEIAPSYFPSKETVLKGVGSLAKHSLTITLFNGGIFPITPDEFAVVVMRFSYAQFLKLGFKGLFKLLELFQHLSTLKKLGLISLFFAPMASAADWNPYQFYSCCEAQEQVANLANETMSTLSSEINNAITQLPSGCTTLPTEQIFTLRSSLLNPMQVFAGFLLGGNCFKGIFSKWAPNGLDIIWNQLSALDSQVRTLLQNHPAIVREVTAWVTSNIEGFNNQSCAMRYLNQTIAGLSSLAQNLTRQGYAPVNEAMTNFRSYYPTVRTTTNTEMCYVTFRSDIATIFLGATIIILAFSSLGVCYLCHLRGQNSNNQRSRGYNDLPN